MKIYQRKNTYRKRLLLVVLSLLFILGFSSANQVQAKALETLERSTLALKIYMKDFGGFISDLEIMRLKEKKPDWSVIQNSLDNMAKTLAEMKAADVEKKYQQFTGLLTDRVSEMKAYAKKKDKKKFYESFDQMTNTCFSCHAVHRPSDFLVPKGDHPRVSKK